MCVSTEANEIRKRVVTASGKRSRAAELGVGAESSGGPLSLVAAATSTACAPGRELRCPRFSSFEHATLSVYRVTETWGVVITR